MKVINYTIRILSILFIVTVMMVSSKPSNLLAQEAASDIVSWSSDGNPPYTDESGDILDESYDGIDLKLKNGVVRKIRYDQLNPSKKILYREEATEYNNAVQLQESGNYRQAIELYKKVIADTRLRPVFKQSALYNIAFLYQKLNQLDKAFQAYDDLLNAFPQGRYIRQAFVNKSICAPNPQAALDVLNSAETKVAQLENMEPKFLLELGLQKAKLLEDNGKLDEAKALYNNIVNKASKEPAILARAQVGIARIELKNNNYSNAEKLFTEVIEKSNDAIAKAGAYNGRAECALAASTPDYKKALSDYLRSKLLYPAPEGESTIEEEKAIFNAGLCFERLAQSLPAEKKKENIGFARAQYQDLILRFPASKFVPDAKKRLVEIGSSK